MTSQFESNLTPNQIENWKNVLYSLFGPFILFLDKKDLEIVINAYRARLQREIDNITPATCICDRSKQGQTVHKDGLITCNFCKGERK